MKVILSLILVITLGVFVGTFPTISDILYHPSNLTLKDFDKESQKQIRCLAKNMYYEAAHEPELGQRAVSHVVFNRIDSGKFPESVCEVVYQKTSGTCQFSWVCQSRESSKDMASPQYKKLEKIAVDMFLNREMLNDPTKGSTYYHADYVNPGWHLRKVKQIGRHIFYHA